MSAKYPSLRVEGGFLAAEIIDDIAEGKAPGQKPRDFGFTDQTHLIDQISAAWSDARGFWQSFWRRAETPQEGETGVSFTRAQWVVPLFNILGYDLTLQDRAAEVDGLTFAISHRAGPATGSPPVHVVGAWQSLDRRAQSGRPRLAPHSLVQEYLNRTEFLWGVVTNGRTLRLLRDSQLIRRQAYIEFNLETMFNGEHFADFALFFRLVHRSRLPHPDAKPDACLLEQWYQQTIEQGGRVREHLREGVECAIQALANAILKHPRNAEVRQAAASGELKAQVLYEELLRLVYRLLFLMVTEERNLLTANETYRHHYSISRLRRLCENRHGHNQHVDLWAGLQSSFRLFASEDFGLFLDVPPLNGDLFDLTKTPHLNSATIANADFLNALWSLAMYREDRRSAPRRINYSALDVEELGSVYESLLDLQPVFTQEEGRPVFSLIKGTQRKTTGSYYTHPELVDELVQSALVPVMQERLSAARTPKDKEKALLEITVCDPACGSGHFLLAAARRLARELAQIRSGEEEPSPREYRLALRDVISHCIYGVDRNPLAVELCKVALWLESHAEGKPLSFLDHRILCGNSLVGVRDLAILKNGVPDDAYERVTGDDKDVAREIKKQNKRERVGFQMLNFTPAQDVTDLTAARKELFELPDDTPEQIRKKKAIFEQVRADRKYTADRLAADLWCAAFFAELTEKNLRDKIIPTTAAVLNALEQRQPYGPMVGHVAEIDYRVRFFHWPLEFPEVFARGGFDVILCNPPWERIKLQQEEFFATRDPEIANALNAAARWTLIQRLPERKPALWHEYQQALHDADATGKHLRISGQYPLTARGDINTYAAFAERFIVLVGPHGRVGAVLPTGIATDDTTKDFFASLMESQRIASFLGMDNEAMIYFRGIDHRNKFGLITIGGTEALTKSPVFTFSCSRLEDTRKPDRRFTLTDEDIRLLNPNTRTCPVFRTRADAELTRKIYQRVPVLVNESTGENPWGIRFSTMFHMSNDSHLFRTRDWLEERGFRLSGNRFVKGEEVYLPLYEAKMMHHFDHRYATYEGATQANINEGSLPQPSEQQKQDPTFRVLPRYWVEAREVYLRCAVIPEGLRKAIRAGDLELIRLGLAHLFFAKWLTTSQRAKDGLFKNWCEFVECHLFARSFAPTQLGLCGDNPPLLRPSSADDLPAEPVDKIKSGPREATAWYAPDPKLLQSYTTAMSAYKFRLPDGSVTDADIGTVVDNVLEQTAPRWLLGFRDVASNVVERTAIFSLLPTVGVGHKIPLVFLTSSPSTAHAACFLGNVDSVVFDYVTRQKIGGISFGYFILKQLPVLAPSLYTIEHIRFLVPRVAELACTSWDIQPFPDDVWREADSDLRAAIERQWCENREATGGHTYDPPEWYTPPEDRCPLPPFKWNDDRRARLRAELDAYYAKLYGLDERDLRYILDPTDVYGPDFPGETFRVLKEKEIARYGEYRTRRLVLEAWERIQRG